MEERKEPTEAEKKELFDRLAAEKKANEANHPVGLNNNPKNVPKRNEQEIWACVRSQWEQIIKSID
jgi:hypothetical protein